MKRKRSTEFLNQDALMSDKADESDHQFARPSFIDMGGIQLVRDRRDIYTPLDASRRQIRLLKVNKDEGPVTTDSLLECELVTVSLDDGIAYHALSYVWGDPDNCEPIKLNGEIHLVTLNLYKALCTFIEDEDAAIRGYLWVDALCINQVDVDERGHQVSIMSPIFRQAQTVHIWLGLQGKHTPEALQALRHLITAGSTFTYVLEDDVLMGMEDLLSRSWWSRVWVIAEVVVSSHAILHIGNDIVDFRSVLKVLGDFNVGALRGSFAHLQGQQRNQLEKICDCILRICASFNIQDFSTESTAGIDDILRLLNYGEARKATDLRDLVYGFLGLLPQSLEIRPDYTLPTEEVYKSTAMRLMRWSKSLTPITFTRHRKSKTLPTWVPDLRYDSFDNDLTEFNATLGLPALMDEELPGQLRVHGKIIDAVDIATSRCPILSHEPILGSRWYHEFRIYLMQCEYVAFEGLSMRMFDKDSTEASGESVRTLLPRPQSTFHRQSRDAFWRALIRHNSKAANGILKYDYELRYIPEIESWLYWRPEGSKHHDHDARLNSIISTVSSKAEAALRDIRLEIDGRVFFRTKQNHFGQTSALPTNGDVIALLAGLRCPMILRRTSSSRDHYEVVGPCYYDGGMYGESIVKPIGDDAPRDAIECGFEELVLV